MPSNTEIRQAYGKAIAVWFDRNEWPQKICELWSQAADNGVKGPWASQISQVMHCRVDPRTSFFSALGAFNAAVAERDLLTVRKNDALTHDRLCNADPFLLDDGRPATGTDFFAMFIGDMKLPNEYVKARRLTKDDLENILIIVNQATEHYCLETYCTISDLVKELDKRLFRKRGEYGQLMKRALLGFALPSPEEFESIVDSDECNKTGCPILVELTAMLQEESHDPQLVEELNTELRNRFSSAARGV